MVSEELMESRAVSHRSSLGSPSFFLMPVLFHVSDSLEGHRHCTYILSPQSEVLMVKLLLAQTSEGLVLRM